MNRRALLATLAMAGAAGTLAPPADALPHLFGRRTVAPTRHPSDFSDIGFSDWSDQEAEYRFYPGDQLDVQMPTAPELNRQVTVAPDGRVSLPLIGQVMIADRTVLEAEQGLSEAYARQLVRPVVEVSLRQAAPVKVFVAGEVANPGIYDMPGDIDAFQAVIMAGGFKPTARRGEVGLVRRGGDGGRMLRSLDLSGRAPPAVALRRFDIVYVPRSRLGEIAAFMTQVRDSLPFGFSYSLNSPYGN